MSHRMPAPGPWYRRRWVLAPVLLAAVAAGYLVFRPADGTRGPPASAWSGGAAARSPNVIELPAPWLARGCGGGCANAYLELVARYARARGPATAVVEDPGGGRLRRRIVASLAIGFLLDGLAERPLAVAVLDETRRPDGVIRRRLLFWDPAVGSFEASLLLPPGEGPFPAVIGLHGHRDDDEVFAEEYLGDRLARGGIAVLIPRLRAHDCSWRENRIARGLLEQGFTLMGLRVYETLLMHKYLEHSDAVDARRVGLLGHSGGSSTANLAVRVADRFRVYVVDYQVDYYNQCGPLDVHCESVPALVPLAAEINDSASLAVPHLLVPYKFPDPELRARIVEFFRRHLRSELDPS